MTDLTPTRNGVPTGAPKTNTRTRAGMVELGPLKGFAGFMLRIAQIRFYEAYFDEFEDEGITPGAIGILAAIMLNPGVRQGVLADALRIKRSNMAKIVRSLDRQGLIETLTPVLTLSTVVRLALIMFGMEVVS